MFRVDLLVICVLKYELEQFLLTPIKNSFEDEMVTIVLCMYDDA